MGRRFIVLALILAFFLVGSYYAARPFAAEVAAGRGDLALAIRLDPLNAAFHARLGERYADEANAAKSEAAWASAGAAYAEAVRLSPLSSEYRIRLAECRAHSLAKRGMVPGAEMDAYVDNLKKAVEYNPNYYYVNAAAGYYLLLFRARLVQSDRNFAIYRLRYALELNPDYRNNVFSYVANGLGDYKILQQITPRSKEWEKALLDFLRDIDKWKYRRE